VGKSGCKFSINKLEFFNSMHIRNRFDEKTQGKDATETWRQMLLENVEEDLHAVIKRFDSNKMR